ncbi:MAG: SAM-dependent methyltransferase, partial [Anaerolineae bacterium]|nr:SAM-dependent methyltransferase [Anaerolineae bacterium]
MSGITVVGLGPGDSRHVTREAWDVLVAADEVWLRTNQHPTVRDLPERLVQHSFDYLYQQAAEFGNVYESIADEVLALGRRPEGVIYAVPGHPLVGEATVQRLLGLVQDQNIRIRIVEGLSFIAPILTALGVDALEIAGC